MDADATITIKHTAGVKGWRAEFRMGDGFTGWSEHEPTPEEALAGVMRGIAVYEAGYQEAGGAA